MEPTNVLQVFKEMSRLDKLNRLNKFQKCSIDLKTYEECTFFLLK